MIVVHALPVADAWGMHGDIGWGWMVAMVAAMLLFWGAIILGVVWLMRAGTDRQPGHQSGKPTGSLDRRETPSELLDRRFAEGAMSMEDYQARRKVLADSAGQENAARTDEAVIAGRRG